MNSVERREASAATNAATGITHYLWNSAGDWKAVGSNDAVIVSLVVSKEMRGKGTLHVHAGGRRLDITYSIVKHDNHFVIDAVMNGTPSQVTFSEGGEVVDDGLRRIVDPVINEMFHSIDIDLMERAKNRRRPVAATAHYSAYHCLGIYDAMAGALKANEFFAYLMLANDFDNC